jgi:protein-tyrosine phosphatase
VNQNPENFEYLKLGLKDESSEIISEHFIPAIEFIQKHVDQGKNVLVHCMAGKSRSVTIILAYLIHSQKYSLQDALKLVLKKNSNVCPNLGFFKQLVEFELEIRGSNSINIEQYASIIAHLSKVRVSANPK